MNKKFKEGLIEFSCISAIIIALLAYVVIAGAPGVTHESPPHSSEDADGDITTLGVYVTNDSFNYIHNVTVQCNFTSVANRNLPVYFDNCSGNYSDENISFNNSGNNFTQAGGFFNATFTIPNQGWYMHYRFVVCNNNSECTTTANYSVFYSQPAVPLRSAPTIDLIDPPQGLLSRTGNITFNASWTPTDSYSTEGNMSFFWNATPTAIVTIMNYTKDNIQYYTNDTMSNTSHNRDSLDNLTGIIEYYNFTTDEILGGFVADNMTIFWTTYGCNNNGTTEGNCSWATGNRTINVDYPDPERTAPTATITTPANGTVGNDSMRITVEATDNINLDNITIFWEHVNGTYPSGNESLDVYSLVQNDTLDMTADDGNTSVTWTFSYDDLTHNATANITDTSSTVDGSDGWVIFNVIVCDNSSAVNCVNNSGNERENLFYEVDTTVPHFTAINNQTINFTCDKWEINLTTNEEVNMSLEWYKVFENGTGEEVINYSITDTSFDLYPRVNLTEMVSNTKYAYNFSLCDKSNNCNTSTNHSLSIDFRFAQSLCEGWTHVGILNTTTNSSDMTDLLNASNVAFWQSNQSFDTYTRDAPTLGGGVDMIRGNAMLVYMDHDSTFPIEYRNDDNNNTFDNTTESWANVTGVKGEWTNFGLLQHRTVFNISHAWNGPALENISFYSRWLNNDTQSAYWDQIYNRTRNLNRTILEGESLWIYANANFSLNRTGEIHVQDN